VAPFTFDRYNARVRPAVALAVALGAVFVTTAAAAPKPHVERVRAGEVEAIFSYTYDRAKFRFEKQRLTIKRLDETRFSARLRRPPRGGFNAQPARYFQHRPSVSITDLDGDGEPEVLLDLYWGGAHCCWYTQIYRYVEGASRYAPLVHVWGNVGYVLADFDHNGRQELVSRDDRFSYAFGSFAESRWPVRILGYAAGKLSFVTRKYPSEIRRDAVALWREAMAGRRAPNQAIVAAWAADQCMLGRWPAAFRTIDRLARSGRIHGERTRVAFERRLRRFLKRTGYL
jgi:hypothetical protein